MVNRRTSGCAARRGYQIAASAFIVAVLAPNLWALVHPHEDWPYSSLPMYAHYVGEHTPRFKFVFVAELADGREAEVSPYSIGLDYAAMRFFFKYAYGSVEPGGSPYNIYPEDTRAAFEARLGRFFATYARQWARRHPGRPLRALRLRVARLRWADNGVEDVREIGRHDVASGRFTHTWSPS